MMGSTQSTGVYLSAHGHMEMLHHHINTKSSKKIHGAELHNVFVYKPYRHKSYGIKMVRGAMKYYRQGNNFFFVHPERASLEKFYKRCGFKRVDRRSSDNMIKIVNPKLKKIKLRADDQGMLYEMNRKMR